MTDSAFERDFSRLARAIDAILVAGHAQRHWLKPGCPPLSGGDAHDNLTAALVFYGGQPSAGFDLWIMCRAIEELSLAWTGAGVPLAQAMPPPAPAPEQERAEA